jgi:hypothetical protein
MVVAEQLGYDHETALTLDKGVASLNAQSKGRRLGIFEKQKGLKEERKPRARQRNEQLMVRVLSCPVPAGQRAIKKGNSILAPWFNLYISTTFMPIFSF